MLSKRLRPVKYHRANAYSDWRRKAVARRSKLRRKQSRWILSARSEEPVTSLEWWWWSGRCIRGSLASVAARISKIDLGAARLGKILVKYPRRCMQIAIEPPRCINLQQCTRLVAVVASETKHLVGADIEVSGLFILWLMTIPVSRHSFERRHEPVVPCVTRAHRDTESSSSHRVPISSHPVATGPFSAPGPL